MILEVAFTLIYDVYSRGITYDQHSTNMSTMSTMSTTMSDRPMVDFIQTLGPQLNPKTVQAYYACKRLLRKKKI
jgi:hypothetical protein